MPTSPRTHKHYLWLILFLLSISPFVARLFDHRPANTCHNEKYDASLSGLTTIDAMVNYIDQRYKGGNLQTSDDTSRYVLQLSELFKSRFCHGELNFRFSENWLAWLSGKLFWSHFSSMVLTKDVMKHTKCLCNQQTLAFMEALHKKGISSRTIGLGDEVPGHFLCEVRYSGQWHLFDISLEPNWESIDQPHRELEYYLTNKDMFYRIYEGRIPRSLFDAILVKHAYGDVNDFPGKKMKFFQTCCEILSYLLPVASLLMFLWGSRKRSRRLLAVNTPLKEALSDTLQK